MISSVKEHIKSDLVDLLKQYTHGVPTYNDSFKAKLIHIIDSNFSQIEKHHDTSQSTID